MWVGVVVVVGWVVVVVGVCVCGGGVGQVLEVCALPPMKRWIGKG